MKITFQERINNLCSDILTSELTKLKGKIDVTNADNLENIYIYPVLLSIVILGTWILIKVDKSRLSDSILRKIVIRDRYGLLIPSFLFLTVPFLSTKLFVFLINNNLNGLNPIIPAIITFIIGYFSGLSKDRRESRKLEYLEFMNCFNKLAGNKEQVEEISTTINKYYDILNSQSLHTEPEKNLKQKMKAILENLKLNSQKDEIASLFTKYGFRLDFFSYPIFPDNTLFLMHECSESIEKIIKTSQEGVRKNYGEVELWNSDNIISLSIYTDRFIEFFNELKKCIYNTKLDSLQ